MIILTFVTWKNIYVQTSFVKSPSFLKCKKITCVSLRKWKHDQSIAEFSVSRPWRNHQAWSPFHSLLHLLPPCPKPRVLCQPPETSAPAKDARAGLLSSFPQPCPSQLSQALLQVTFQPHLHPSSGMCQVPRAGTAPLLTIVLGLDPGWWVPG